MYQPNNFYQPYQNPFFQNQPIQQNQITQLAGRCVTDFGLITASEIPMDGSCAIFPKTDRSQIQMRYWSPNGTIEKIIYEPISNDVSAKSENVASNNVETQISALNDSTSDLKKVIDSLAKKVDGMYKQIEKGGKE